MKDDWSPWCEINKPCGYSSHGVYQLRYVDAAGTPCPLNRFLGTDVAGLLYVGEGASVEQRRKDIITGIECWNMHMAGIMIHILRKYSEAFRRQHGDSRLQIRFEKHASPESRKLREERLIKDYVMVFGEVPPLNSAIPNRHSCWEAEFSKMAQPSSASAGEPAELLDPIKIQILDWLEGDRGKDRMLLTDTFRSSLLACKDLESVRLLLSQQVYANKPAMRLTPNNVEWLIEEARKSFRGSS